MPFVPIDPDARLSVERDSVAICIPVYGATDLLAQCLRTLIATTPGDVPVLVADDASPGPDVEALVRSVAEDAPHAIHFLRQPENLGFVGNVNAAFGMLASADVVLLNSDVEVAEGWLEGVLAAARSDPGVATVSTLTNHGTIVSVPFRNNPQPSLPQQWSLEEAAARVRASSLRLYPRLPTGIGHCILIRRAALELVGPFDMTFSPGYGEEVDFSLRCVGRGMSHVLADDVLVAHRGGASFAGDGSPNPRQKANDEIIFARYAFYKDWVDQLSKTDRTPLARAISVARRVLAPLSVTIDGRCLGPHMTGTQLHALELIGALHETGQTTIRVVAPLDMGRYGADALAAMPDVELVPADMVRELDRTDIVHRPYQVGRPEELYEMTLLGHHVVVTHQDLISYNSPDYFPSYRGYERYRQVTRDVFAAADRVLFFSDHARREAAAAGLTEGERADVVPLGTDHRVIRPGAAPRPPKGVDPADPTPFLLCLGTDFRHKNRPFALKLLEALREHHGWEGRLVLAGPRVMNGSSAGEEAVFLTQRPALAAQVRDVAAVDEDEKAWLLARAAAVVYPTTIEGFGLVPFEAAEAGVPCAFAPVASLADLLSAELATIVPWDVAASAAALITLLRDESARQRHLAGIREAGARLRWSDTGTRLVEAYDEALRNPRPLSGDNVLRSLVRESRVTELEQRLEALGLLGREEDPESIPTPIDLAVARRGGPVPTEVKRATLAVATRRWLRTPIFGTLRLSYRLRGKHANGDPEGGAQ